MSPRLFLHGDSTVSPSFHSPRRLDGLSGSAGICSSRFASLSSLRGRRKDVPVQGPLLRSDNLAPSLREDYGSHFRHPPQVWTIDSSWSIQNSSLVYLGMEIRSLPFIAWPPPIRVSNLPRLLEEFVNPISSSVPLASSTGPLIVPHFSRSWRDAPNEAAPALPQGPVGFPGQPVSGLLIPSLSRVSSLVGSSGPAAWRSIFFSSSPRRQLLIRRFRWGLGGPS